MLILDEIINLPLAAQQMLLDLVQFGTYRPLGHAAAEPRRAALRILAVTNGDLDAAVSEGRFRRDLFHRLAGVHLRVSPLRTRRGDIPGIAGSLLASIAPAGERWALSRDARQRLVAEDLSWDGNTRELEALLRRASARVRLRAPLGPHEITAADLEVVTTGESPRATATPRTAGTANPARRQETLGDLASRWSALQAERSDLDRRELALIDEAMASHGGVVSQAARALGIARTTLSSRLAARNDR